MSQNVLSQSGCTIFQATISPEQLNEIAWFFACGYKFKQFESSSKMFWVGMVKNGCGQFGHGTLKLYLTNEQLE